MSGGNQSADGAMPNAEAISVIECAAVKAVTTPTSGRMRRNGNDQAEEEEEVVDPPEDVLEAEPDELASRLQRAGIERDEPGIAAILVGPLAPVARRPPQDRRRRDAEVGEERADGEARRAGGDRIREHHVEHRLSPGKLLFVSQRGRRDARARRVEAHEAAVGREADPRPFHGPRGESLPVLVQLEIAGDPERGGLAEKRRGLRDVQVVAARPRKVDVAHRLERDAHHEPQRAAVGAREHLHRHTRRHLVPLK